MSGMPVFRAVLAPVIFVALTVAPGYAWHGSGTVGPLAITPPTPSAPFTIYAGTHDRGVFKSTDGGMTWSATGLSGIGVLKVDPQATNTVYAGGSGGIFRSADGGASWAAINTNLNVQGLAIDSKAPRTIYALSSGGVFKSTDDGASWNPTTLIGGECGVGAGCSYFFVTALAIVPQSGTTPDALYASVHYYGIPDEGLLGGEWTELLRSTDGGAGWSYVPDLPGWTIGERLPMAVDPETPTTVYAGGYGVIHKSTDAGASWSRKAEDPSFGFVQVLAIDPQTPSTLYAVAGARMFKSTDGSATWGTVSADLDGFIRAYGPTSVGVTSVAIDPVNENTVYAGTGIGVFKSVDGGGSWHPTALIQHSPLHSVRVDPSDITGGTTTTGTVNLMTAAPIGGATITLSSNDPAIATVPDSVTVPAGATSGSFPVSTNSVTATTWVPIRASFDDATRHALVRVHPIDATTQPPLASFTSTCSGLTCAFDGSSSLDADGTIVSYSWTFGDGTTGFGPTASHTYAAAGTYSVALTVTDNAGGTGTHSTSVTASQADTDPPDTSIVSAVNGNGASVPDDGTTLSNAITLVFTGTDNVAVAGFECGLDRASFTPCTSPVTYSGLAVGRHDFAVRAVDTSNNQDGAPALYTWTVDSHPETTITSAVDGGGKTIPDGGTTRSYSITFRFTGTDNGGVTGFKCSLDGAAFTPCASPINYTNVRRGTHTFRVRAIDNNGFPDSTPAAFRWIRR